MKKIIFGFFVTTLVAMAGIGSVALASHSWGGYHWARTSNPFTLKLGSNLSGVWGGYLATASSDWSVSTVFDTTVVPGTAFRSLSPHKDCSPTAGRVEVCNKTYGNNGWLGVAQIWITSGTHITQGTVKLNDTYFNTSKYNTTAWKNLVTCQEVGHTFGLDHQDTNFYNANLGTCMDYTNDPTGTAGTNGTLDNEHPNAHDYEELGIIYSHLDTTTTITTNTTSKNGNSANGVGVNLDNPSDWGKSLRKDSKGRDILFERDLGNGNKVSTFVTWAD